MIDKSPLGNYIDVISGYAFKTKNFVNVGVPIIKIKNITPPEVTLDDVSFISNDIANKLPKYELKQGDVLIAMTGSHINQINSVVGRVAKVKYNTRTMLNQRVGKIVLIENAKACLNYIYYFLSQYDTKLLLASNAGGAANQANISPDDIKNLLLPVPPLPTQKRIADILSAYDDLIENNQRQIKLLEEAAMLLYKEWFVKLKFPGHENTKIIDGVPKGWRKISLSLFANIIMGQSPPSKFYNNQKRGLPFHQGVANFGNRFVKNDIYTTEYKREAQANSIIFSVRAPVGRINMSKDKIALGRGVAAINHKQKLNSYLLYMLKEHFFKENIIGNGAIFASVTKTELENVVFLVGNDILTKKFNAFASNIDTKISCLEDEIDKAQTTRDKLLPKLMNGEIEV